MTTKPERLAYFVEGGWYDADEFVELVLASIDGGESTPEQKHNLRNRLWNALMEGSND